MMNEDFLHFIWQFQRFNHNNLFTTDGESLQILKAGTLNKYSGPDFFNGQVFIEDTKLAGNIEIHVKSSDWIKHKHHFDPSYDSIILHVVWKNDVDLKNRNGTAIPCLELKGRLTKVSARAI